MFLINFNVKSYAANTVMTLNIDGEIIEYNQPNVAMKVDGVNAKQGDMPPIIIENRTLIPVRELFESMGANVEWLNETREVHVSLDNTKIELKIGSSNIKIIKDGTTTNKTIDVPAKIINSKTMIPLRAVGEGLGCNVE
ncbi:MAG: copper amine oxidase N-terminal domain-containing protein [Clostridia bacterium]|nr:copper amine oxidase N-terminal domain-containing protein [Clostridia bacterium]